MSWLNRMNVLGLKTRLTEQLGKVKRWRPAPSASRRIGALTLGTAMGCVLVAGARLLCLYLGWRPSHNGGFWRELVSPSHPCPCATLTDSHLQNFALSIRQSALYHPVALAASLLVLFGAARVGARIEPLWRSLRSGLLKTPLGFVLGIAAGDWMVVGLHGVLWEISLVWRIARHVHILRGVLLVTAAAAGFVWRRLGQTPTQAGADEALWGDRPLDSTAGDAFDRRPLVRTIRREALQPGASVIALVGEYGAGKSSVLNFAAARMSSPDSLDYGPTVKPIVVRFNAWLPDNGTTLTAAFLKELQSAIASEYVVPRLSRRMRGLMRVFVSSLPHAPSDVTSILPDRSQQDEIEGFCHLLDRLRAPVVVLIDEIDRMDPSEVGELFKLLRGFPDTPNLRFVCSLDLKGVAKAVAFNRPGADGEQYVEKFFPVRVALSSIEPAQYEKYYGQFLASLRTERPGDEWKEIEDWLRDDPAAAEVFDNPRRIKSVLRSFRASFRLLADEVNWLDLLRLHAATALRPALREILFDRWYYFLALSNAAWIHQTGRIADSPVNAAPQRAAFYENTFGAPTEAANLPLIRLLGQMFPLVDLWRQTGNADPGAGDFPDPAKCRIYDRRFFPIYFLNRVPEDQFSRAALNKLAADIESASDAEAAKHRLSGELRRVAGKPQRRVGLFRGLLGLLTRPRVSRESRRGVARAIAEHSFDLDVPFPPIRLGLENPGWGLSANVIWECVRQQPAINGEYDHELLGDVISKSSLEFAAALFLDRAINGDPMATGSDDEATLATLRQAMDNRLRSEFASNKALGPTDYLSSKTWQSVCLTVSAWAACGPDARKRATEYFAVQYASNTVLGSLFIERTWRRTGFTFRSGAGIDLPAQIPPDPPTVTGLLYPRLEDLRKAAEHVLAAGGPEDAVRQRVREFVDYLDRHVEKSHAAAADTEPGPPKPPAS